MDSKRLSYAVATIVMQCIAAERAQPAELPVPCVSGACGPGVGGFLQSGQAGAVINGNTLRIDQQSDRAVLNWKSFDISADGRVVFQQPGPSAIALNRIYQQSPSRIFGALEANGQIYLINQNGFIFGADSRTRTAGLLASTLNITDDTFAAGILAADQPALRSDGRTGVVDAAGRPVIGPDGKQLPVQILVQDGAQISTVGAGQRVLLASRTVDNAGKLQADDGQVIVAAGEKVYLQASTDSQLRGILVEVDTGGEAWNRLTGEMTAARGNITVAGLAVNQQGRISATTSITANGSIRLQGRDTVVFRNGNQPTATRGGKVELGAQSQTTVLPELQDKATAVDDQPQVPSQIDIAGQQIILRGGSRIIAPGGSVGIAARRDSDRPASKDVDSRLRIEDGAVIDVSGSNAAVPIERNLVTVELRANELRDAPTQRDGPLRGQKVVIDARVGTPLADVSGALGTVQRDIAERTSKGGSVVLSSQGDIVVANGARIDVSGGQVDYRGGNIQTTQLVRADGRIVDIGTADPTQQYVGLVNPTYQTTFDRWGVVETHVGASVGHFEAGYVQGADAGVLQFIAPNMVLNGDFQGSVVNGPRQQTSTTAAVAGRFIVGVPTGLDLSIFDYGAPSVRLTSAAPNIVVNSQSPLIAGRTLELPTQFLTQGGFGTAQIYSNGTVTLPESTPLTLRPGTLLDLLGWRVEVGSDISTSGGTIRLTSDHTLAAESTLPQPGTGVYLAPGARLDVSGTWTNDLVGATRQHYQNAGGIELAARSFNSSGGTSFASTLSLGNRAALWANGGAWRDSQGSLTVGGGGAIALRSPLQDSAVRLGDAIDLQAFGVQGQSGGSFALDAGRITIVDGDTWAVAQSFDPRGGDAATLRIGDALFSRYGFSSFDLDATGPGSQQNGNSALRIGSGAQIDTRPQTLALQGDLGLRPSGGTVAGFSQRTQLADNLLAPGSLTLRTDSRAVNSGSAGGLVMESGTSIRTVQGSSVAMSSPGGALLAGSVTAPGGSISVSLPKPPDALDRGYDAVLSLELTSSARLDASGIVVLRPSDTPQRNGSVLPGGKINVIADRGSVLIRDGAVLDVSGTQGELDLASTQSANGTQREIVASAGGQIVLRSPDSILLQGSIDAAGGTGGMLPAAGGSLSVQLTRDRGFALPTGGSTNPFPSDPRAIRVVDFPFAATRLPDGMAFVGQSLVNSSGIDSLELVGGDVVSFDPKVSLSLRKQLQIDAPQIDIGSGGSVNLSAPYVSLGYTLASTRTQATPASGGGVLNVRGELIELIGSTTLQHAASVRLQSSGDVRMRGVENRGISRGEFDAGGDLTLAAARIYPTTLSDFTIKLLGTETNTLTIEQSGNNAVTPLSAAGSVKLSADNIVQGGTLLAPFGSLALNAAQSLDLRSGSVTSVSAAGTTVPFGRVELGSDWLYSVGPTLTTRTSLPVRSIDLSAPNMTMASTAKVDLRGGGDLYAYSWLPGTGGSRDALAPGQIPGLYAIVPGLTSSFAPYDPQEYQRSDLAPGTSVYLSDSPYLPAGNYALLPARYALLPGAVLVRAVSGYSGLRPGSTSALPDGTTVVAGYRTFGATGLGSGQYAGFAISKGDVARQLASYEDFRASTFYPAQAARLDLGRVAIPADAGTLRLSIANSLAGQADILTAPTSSGRGAAIDIAATRLSVGGAASAPGVVRLDAATLQQWNPASLLLGGTRNTDGGIAVTADTVSFAPDAQLQLAELIAVANTGVSLAAGSRIASSPISSETSGASASTLSGNAAVLAISNRPAFDILRSNATSTGGGAVTVESGVRVESAGVLLIDAPVGGSLLGTFSAAHSNWILGSRQLSFAPTAASSGLTLLPSLATQMQSASGLTLRATDSINFLQPVSLSGFDSLTLDAGVLRASNAGTNVELAARQLVLHGGGSSLPALTAGTSTLSLRGDDIRLTGGNLGFNGFGQAQLIASKGFSTEGTMLVQAPGDLQLSAARFSSAAAADAVLVANGAVWISSPTSDAGLAPVRALGGSLSISGATLDVDGRIVLPSGFLTLAAVSRLSLSSGALLDTGGMSVSAGGRQVYSPGGVINLNAGTDLLASPGTTLRVNGNGDSDAGTVNVLAGGNADIRSTLEGRAEVGARGATFNLAAARMQDFNSLNTLLEAGGFREQRRLRVQQGDLVLAANGVMTARDVELSADNGTVRVAGSVVARGADAQRGSIELHAGQAVILEAGAQLTTAASGSIGRGGDIVLGSSRGTVSLLQGSRINAHGDAEDGSVLVRAPAVGNDVAVSALGSALLGVSTVQIEPVLVRTAPESVSGAQLSSWLDEAQTFGTQAAPLIVSRLSGAGATPIRVEPGLELQRNGNLLLGSTRSALDLDLASWRTADRPVSLTARATGSLTVNGVISDGYSLDSNSGLYDFMPGASGSLRLVAGADLAAADPLATQRNAAADFRLIEGVLRTGSGNLSLAASRDVIFSGALSSVYTGGVPALDSIDTGFGQLLSNPVDGGSLRVLAGRDIVGNSITQDVGSWQMRQGQTGQYPLRWGVDAGGFAWNVGSLGGGDVTLVAGRDLRNAAVAVADNAVQKSGGELVVNRGGVLAVDAVRDVSSTMFHVTNGTNRINAGGSLGRTRPGLGGQPLGTLLSMQDARLDVTARGNIFLESVFNPTVLTQRNVSEDFTSYFLSYGADSSLKLLTTAGDISTSANRDRVGLYVGDEVKSLNDSIVFTIAPPRLTAHALTGDVGLSGSNQLVLHASADGQLDLFAARDIRAKVLMSDAQAAVLPSPQNPSGNALGVVQVANRVGGARHLQDDVPAQITAGRDVLAGAVSLSKFGNIVAGRDIVDLSFFGQNMRAGDITSISAGRDIRYSRTATNASMSLGGPGRLDLLAGRDVDLGFSGGITTTGRLTNPAITTQGGASVGVFAGLDQPLDTVKFLQAIVEGPADYRAALVTYVTSTLQKNVATYEAAKSAFLAVASGEQRPFLMQVFFKELVRAGREANTSPETNFQRGYAAIDSLLPGSRNVDASSTWVNPYSGDLRMAFSRIYTLDGGDITLFIPGGGIDVGLAVPPATGAPNRKPSELGIVAQRTGAVRAFASNDVLVNSSRVFTLTGGDITIWSTTGDIDAGRGAKSAISAPAPTLLVSSDGTVRVDFAGAVAGSGIRSILTDTSLKAGDVDLIAPAGIVNAGDAGIGAAGNLNVAAQQVVGLDNIQVGGSSTGVPAETSSLGASLSGVSASSTSASGAASSTMAQADSNGTVPAPLADSVLGWLDVFVEGFGTEVCKPSDAECLERNRRRP